MALTHTPPGEIGSQMPRFQLPGTDGKTYDSEDYFLNAKGALVMFICNHCPYVKAIEDRLIDLGHDLKSIGVRVVGISANDANEYPEDSFENMKIRSELKKYSFPFLYDESQQVAKSFGAVCTPDFFLFDSKFSLKYRGRLDDSWKDASLVKNRELFEAANLLSKGADPDFNQNSSMGCSIKWKK